MTLVGHGYPTKASSVDEVHQDLPTQTIVTRVSGPGTSIFV